MEQIKEMLIKSLSVNIEEGKYDHAHNVPYGMRSRQMHALIDYLVESGVIKEEALLNYIERQKYLK